MASKQKIIYDIITIMTAFGYTDDDKLDEDYIGYKVDEKRAKEIRDSYDRKPMIDPVWIQDMGIVEFTPINYADDKTLPFLNCQLYKATLPPIVSFSQSMMNKNNLGIQIFSADLSNEFYFQKFGDFVMRLKKLSDDHPAHLYQYFTQLMRSVYTTKGTKLRPLLILENPLDGYVLQTENMQSGTLTLGDTFEVISGQATHNGVLYIPGQTFVALNPFFTGTAVVQYLNQKRKMTWLDEYPLSNSQIEIVILKILTEELKIEEQQARDLRNDSQDKSKQTNEQ